MTENLDQWHYFVTPIYSINKPEFLNDARNVSNRSIELFLQENVIDEIRPLVQTDIVTETQVFPLYQYVLNTAWNLMDSQGFDMAGQETYLTQAWSQDHRKFSSMEYHLHNDSYMVAFYFLECPENCSEMVIHDPRPGKVSSPLHLRNNGELNMLSSEVYFKPKPGQLMFVNSWVPHSFTRNSSNNSFKFIHMNISTRPHTPIIEYPATAVIV